MNIHMLSSFGLWPWTVAWITFLLWTVWGKKIVWPWLRFTLKVVAHKIFSKKNLYIQKKIFKKFEKLIKFHHKYFMTFFSLKICICYFGEYLIVFPCFVFRCSTDMRCRNKDKRWFHLTFCFDHNFQYFICLLCCVIFHVIKCIKQIVCLYYSGINNKFHNIYQNRVVNGDSVKNTFYVDCAIAH